MPALSMCLWVCVSLHTARLLYWGPWGTLGGDSVPVLPGQALPLLLRVLVLLGGGMLGHDSLGQEMKGGLAAGAGFASMVWLFFFCFFF